MAEGGARRPQDGRAALERRLADAERRAARAEERLRALDETKDSILSAVSHELRTPLASVIGFGRMLRDRGAELRDADRQDFLDRLLHNAQRLERLLSDLLDLDRLKRGILTPVRSETVVPELLLGIVEEATPPDRVVIVDADPIVAAVDASKVERIVENLVANAAKHSPAERIRVWARGHEAGVLMGVDDEGPGVPDPAKRSVFHAFSRGAGGPPRAPGTGIGLTLVQRFAELHGGLAWVQDRVGGGASFRVFLPARVRQIDDQVIDLNDEPEPAQ